MDAADQAAQGRRAVLPPVAALAQIHGFGHSFLEVPGPGRCARGRVEARPVRGRAGRRHGCHYRGPDCARHPARQAGRGRARSRSHGFLKERFPGSLVIQGDATCLDEITARFHRRDRHRDRACRWSACRWRSSAIIDQGFKAVGPKGFVLQYSYSPVSPVPAKQLGIKARIARFVPLNVPPAFVWKYTREAT